MTPEEAVAALENLVAREGTTHERDALRTLEAEIERLRAERDRYREALERAIQHGEDHDVAFCDWAYARAALHPEQREAE